MISISFGRRKVDVIEHFLAIEKASNSVVLKVNKSKTKYMLSTRNECQNSDLGPNVNIIVQHRGREELHSYWLRNNISVEIKKRIILANRYRVGSLRKLLRSKHLSHKTKVQLLKKVDCSLNLFIVFKKSTPYDLRTDLRKQPMENKI